MKHDKIIPDLAAVRARARRAKKAPDPVRITKARRPPPDDSRTLAAARDFVPASPRERHDGWTPEKQVAFIDALGECGCVTACERVGLSPSTAYRPRRRVDAYSFRAAWDAALDYAIRRLSDAAFSRALHGVARPVWFQGEQIRITVTGAITPQLAASCAPLRRSQIVPANPPQTQREEPPLG